MNLLTVIIPVYNGAAYISSAVGQVLAQDYSLTEVIVVDDGSQDDTVKVVSEAYSEQISQGKVRVIALETNSGPSVARNTGLANTTTPYVTFLDCDDAYSDKSLFSKAVPMLQQEPDVVLFKYVTDHGYVTLKKDYQLPDTRISAAEAFTQMINGDNQIWHFIWNKIYRVSTIRDNDIRFHENLRHSEDIRFNEDVLAVSRKVCFLDTFGYVYNCTNAASVTSKRSKTIATDADWLGYWEAQCANYQRLKATAMHLECWEKCGETLMMRLCKQLIVSSEHCKDQEKVRQMQASPLANEVRCVMKKAKSELLKQKIKNALRRLRRLFGKK